MRVYIILNTSLIGCHLHKTASPTVYYDANANTERPCAPGTVFNESACTCVQDVLIERSTPQPGGRTNVLNGPIATTHIGTNNNIDKSRDT